MAFTPDTLSTVVQSIGGAGIRMFTYETDDLIATVTGTDYFASGKGRGLRVSDLIFVSPLEDDIEPYTLVIDALDADGNATASAAGLGALLARNNLSDLEDVNQALINLGLGGFPGAVLLKANNLSDVADIEVARANLGTFNSVADAEAADIPASFDHIFIEGKAFRRVDGDHPRLGAELIINGNMSSATGWNTDPPWSIGSGVATKAPTTPGGWYINQNYSVGAGEAFLFSYDVATISAGPITPVLQYGVSGTSRTTAGSYEDILLAGTTYPWFGFRGDGPSSATLDNVSIKKLPSDAIQTDDGAWWAAEVVSVLETVTSRRPGVATPLIKVDGYSTPGDRGKADYRKKAVIEADAPGDFTITLADGVTEWRYGYAEGRADVRAFGAVGDGATDDTVAFELAVAVAKHYDIPIYVPAGEYNIGDSILIDFKFAIFGDGPRQSIITAVDIDGPIFDLVVPDDGDPTTTMDYSLCHSLEFRAEFSTTAIGWTNNCVFHIRGVTSADYKFFQWSNFFDLAIRGFYTGFLISLPARTESAGLECNVAWNKFRDIEFGAWTRPGIYGFDFVTGSGTGNEFINLKGTLGGTFNAVDIPGAVLLYQGTGHVVGDIVVLGGHWGSGVTGSRVIAIGADTAYRNRISITGVQVDAGMQFYVTASQTGSEPYDNIKIIGNNVGGGATVWSGPPMRQSQIHEKSITDYRAGKWLSTSSTGALNISAFSVTLPDWGMAVVTVRAAGFIGAIGSGCVEQTFMLSKQGTDPATSVPGDALTTPASPSEIIEISTSISGGVVTFRVDCSPAGVGTEIDAQIEVKAGLFTVAIL